MVWLVIAIPLVSVIAGIVLLTVSIRTFDGLVVDDYYRRGKLINRELARDDFAAQHRLSARITREPGNRLLLKLNGRPPDGLPPVLELKVLHATRAGHDQRIILIRGPHGYYGSLAVMTPGRWDLELSARDWRLLGEWRQPKDAQARLTAGGV